MGTAVLSITNKQKKKEAEKKKGKDGEEKMEVDEKKEEKKEKMEVDEKKDDEKKDEKEKEKEKSDEPEPNFELLSNPARVMKAQLKVVSLEDGKYRPMKDISIGGVIMLDRSTEVGVDEKEEIVEPILVNRGGASSDD